MKVTSVDDEGRRFAAGDGDADRTGAAAGGSAPVGGTLLGKRYALERAVGQGAYGRVWYGRRVRDGAPVAVKVPHREYAGDPAVVSRLRRDWSILRTLDHPHLVAVYDLVVEGGSLATVMEYVPGGNLRTRMRRAPMATEQALTVLAQISHALAHIHAAGLMHGDIKPENILLTERDGQPWAKLTDFGLPWIGPTGTTGAPAGTVAYAAPEVVTGRQRDAAGDVYALGVTAYELLGGQRLFQASDVPALIQAHLTERPRRPSGMSSAHWRLIRACLAKDPAQRPSAAQAATLFEDLRQEGVGLRLVVNLGTATTTAVLRWPDGRVEPLVFDGSSVLPSAVYDHPDHDVLTGSAALAAAQDEPQHCDPYPMLRLGDGSVRMGGREVAPRDLVVAIMRRVARHADHAAGRLPNRVAITHPPSWGRDEFDTMVHACHAADLPTPHFVAATVAAAAHFIDSPAVAVRPGQYAVLCDLGAGSTTISVLRRTDAGGFDILAVETLTDAGGVDVDSAILEEVGRTYYAEEPECWERLAQPTTTGDRRAAWQLWVEVRRAKEALSRAQLAPIQLPMLDRTVHLQRHQLDRIAQPGLDRIATAARRVLDTAAVTTSDVSTALLIGGASRTPCVNALVESLLPRATLIAVDEPELVTVRGAANLSPTLPATPEDREQRRPAGRTIPPRTAPEADAYPARRRRPDQLRPPSRPGGSRDRTPPAVPGYRRVLAFVKSRPRLTLPRLAAVLVLLTTATLLYQSEAGPPGGMAGAMGCGYRIAFLSDSGPTTQPSLQSAELAVDQYNVAHPHCLVQLARYDTQGTGNTAGLATAQVNAIANDRRVLGVIGPASAGQANVALPLLDKAGVVAISPTLSDDAVGTGGYRVFHRVVASSEDDTMAAVHWLTATAATSRVFVVDDNAQETVTNAQLAKRLLGTALVGSASVGDPNGNQTGVLAAIQASGANAIYYSGFRETFGALVPRIRANLPQITIVGAHWVADGLTAGPQAAPPTHTFVTVDSTAPGQAAGDFAAQFQTKYNTPVGYYGPEGYDATNILLAGVLAKQTTRTQMLGWVNSFRGQGITGPLSFKPNGNRANATVVLTRVSNNQFYAPQVIAGAGATATGLSPASLAP